MTRASTASIVFTAVLALLAASLLHPSVLAWAADQKPPSDWKIPARKAKKKNPIPADEKSIAIGTLVYVKECLPCHGTKGKGDGPSAPQLEVHPGDLSNPKMWQESD